MAAERESSVATKALGWTDTFSLTYTPEHSLCKEPCFLPTFLRVVSFLKSELGLARILVPLLLNTLVLPGLRWKLGWVFPSPSTPETVWSKTEDDAMCISVNISWGTNTFSHTMLRNFPNKTTETHQEQTPKAVLHLTLWTSQGDECQLR